MKQEVSDCGAQGPGETVLSRRKFSAVLNF